MINFEQREQLHKLVVLDLAIQSLQRDFSVFEKVKLSRVYLPIIEKLLKSIHNDHYSLKRSLAKQKITIVKWEKVSEYFSDLTVSTPGEDEVYRYANQALKTQVEELLLKRLELD